MNIKQEFREFLRGENHRNIELNNFYNIELKKIEEEISFSEASMRGSIEFWNIKPLFEAVIEPHLIKIKTNNIEKLNDEFKKYNTKFHYSNDIQGLYNKSKDEINIYFPKNIDFNTLEAIIGHEMVHKEQHKNAGQNYFKQSEKIVKRINDLAKDMNLLDMMDEKDIKKYKILNSERNKLLNDFLYLSPYESMAYAYQFVKEYKNLLPQEIIEKLKDNKILINNLTKKYISMYWLIRNKI